jgi:hypothetical protein
MPAVRGRGRPAPFHFKATGQGSRSRMDRFGALEGGKRADRFARLFLREADFVEALQIEPEFSAGAEEMSEAQGGIARDRPLTVQNPGDAVGRHVKLAGQFNGAHAKFFHFFGQVLPGVDSLVIPPH